MERTGYMPSGPKKKKSRSLPTYGRGEPIDHKAIFAAFEKQEQEERKKRQKKKKHGTTYLPLPVIPSQRHSDRESSLSSDTSCSSLEFIRGDKFSPEHHHQIPPSFQEEKSSSRSKESSPSHRPKSRGSLGVSPDVGCISSSPCGTSQKPGGTSSSTSTGRSTKGSTESLTRKERLDALKARVEAEREKYRGSSSSSENEEDRVWHQRRLPRYHSDEALHRSSRDYLSPRANSRLLRESRGRASQDESTAKRIDHSAEKSSGRRYGEVKKPPLGRQGKVSSPPRMEPRTQNCCFTDRNWCNQRRPSDTPYSGSMDITRDISAPWCSQINTVGLPIPPCPTVTGFHQEFRPKNEQHKLDFLTVSTMAGPTLVPQPSPPDSGVSSQSVASSPSLGRAPTPPPRSSLSKAMPGSSGQCLPQYAGYRGQGHRPASCVLDPSSTSRCGHGNTDFNHHWLHLSTVARNDQAPYKRCSIQSLSGSSRQSSSLSSSRGEIQSHRPPPPPSGSRIADPLYNYTEMSPPVPHRQNNPTVYSYTDQAPKPKETYPHHGSSSYYQSTNGTLSDSQADLKQSDLNFRRLLCNMQREGKTDWRRNGSRNSNVIHTGHFTNPSTACSYRNDGVYQAAISRIRNNHYYDSRETLSSPTSTRDVYSPEYPASSPAEVHPYKDRQQLKKYSEPEAVPTSRYSRTHQEAPLNSQAKDMNHRIDQMIQQEKEKRCSQKLENALEELETIYRSLKLNEDDDLLDRAERRDLPTEHQLARLQSSPPQCTPTSGHVSQPEESALECTSHPLARSHSDNIQSLLRRHVSGSCESFLPSTKGAPSRPRRSGIPNKVTDDFAFRKQQRPAASSSSAPKPMSYLLCSPHFTPTLSVKGHLEDIIIIEPKPDPERDDLVNRKFTQADAAKVNPPHPPFGIPLGPVPQSSSTDYLHAQPANAPNKPVFRPQEAPDMVRDDMAFRNLRKDENHNEAVEGNSTRFKTSAIVNRKKNRAVRSLSANISQLMECESRDKTLEFERAQSMTDLIAAMEEESTRWQQLDSDQRKFPPVLAKETVWSPEPLCVYREPQNSRLSGCSVTSGNQKGLTDQQLSHQPKIPHLISASNATRYIHESAWRSPSPMCSPDLRRVRGYSPGGSTTSVTTPSPVLPKKHFTVVSPPSSQNELWSDSDCRRVKVRPLDEGQLEELLSSLARETRVTSPVQEVTNRRNQKGMEAVRKGELHDVTVLA